MKAAIPLFDNGQPTKPLLRLLQLTDVTHDGTLEGVHRATQERWRQHGKHSGDIVDIYPLVADQVVPIFEELGYVGEQSAPRKQYDIGIIFGAYILAVRKRFAMLKRLWDDGLRFDQLVLLGSARKAHPEKESLAKVNSAEGGLDFDPMWENLEEVPPTEAKLMETVLWQSDLPAEWRDNFLVVETPLRTDRPEKPDPSGEDTIRQWLDYHDASGSTAVGVYSQPQLRHMEVVCRRLMVPRGIEVDLVGYAAPPNTNVSQVLDSVAKVIHELATV